MNLAFDGTGLVERYMHDYQCTEREARNALNTASCARLLNLLGREAGLLEQSVADALSQEQERLSRESARLESEKRSCDALSRDLENRRQTIEQAEAMETPEMRDRVRAVGIFQKLAGDMGVKDPALILAGCAGILAGAPVNPAQPVRGWHGF